MKVAHIVKALSTMLSMPIRLRRNPDRPPVTPEHYVVPELASSLETTTTKAADVPVVKSPPNGWTEDWPPLVLAGCDEQLVEGAESRNDSSPNDTRAERCCTSEQKWESVGPGRVKQ